MYYQDSCPHCVAAKKALAKELSSKRIIEHNLKNKKEYDEFIKLGGVGVPFFVSKTTRQTFSGNPKTFDVLLKKLNTPATKSSSLKDLRVKIFVSDSCGYCKRLKQMLSSTHNLKNVALISTSDSAFERESKKYKFNGYPFIVSETTGKHILGAPPSIEKMIMALQ